MNTKERKELRKQLRMLWLHVEMGLHSNIPECCVHWFVTHWLWVKPKEFDEVNRKILKLIKEGFYLGYIPCPDCIKKKKFVRVKICKSECKFNDWKWVRSRSRLLKTKS